MLHFILDFPLSSKLSDWKAYLVYAEFIALSEVLTNQALQTKERLIFSCSDSVSISFDGFANFLSFNKILHT